MVNMMGHNLMGSKVFGVTFGVMLPEILFSLFIILLCFVIYFKTKDLYSLTKHKGIHYFRNTFLFFALAFIIRFLLSFRFLLHGFRGHLSLPFLILSLLFVFSSSMAILSLSASIFYKTLKLKKEWLLELGIILFALLLVLSVLFFMNSFIIILTQAIVVLISLIFLLLKQKANSQSKIRQTYLLLFLFWVITMYLMDPISRFFQFRLIAYVMSALIFGLITYKTIRITK